MTRRVGISIWAVLTLVAAIAAASLAAPLGLPEAGTAAAQGLARVRLGVLGVVPEAGFYVALDQGYFREQGIELEMTQFDSAARMVPALGTGQLEAGNGSHSAGLFNAAARDIRIKLVADAGSGPAGQPIVALMFRRALVDGGQLRGPGDLRGRRVALPARALPTEVLLADWLRGGGLQLADIEIVEMGFPDQMPAFGSGAIDATVIPEPFQTRLVDQGLATIYQQNDAIYPGYQVAEVMYGAAFAQDQPDVARRFMVAYLRGVRMYNDAFVKGDAAARQTTVASLVQHTAVKDPALYNRMVMAGLNPDGRINVTSIAENQEYWLASGQQQARVDLNTIVDYTFADAAVQVLGPYR